MRRTNQHIVRCPRLLAIVLGIILCTVSVEAQLNQCNSAYSRFGLGLLNDQAQGFNKSMSGVGIGIRQGNILNYANPASYSAIDSLSMIIDAGVTLALGSTSQGGVTQNLRNAQLDHVSAGFRLRRGLGFTLGFMPFSSIGYSFQKTAIIANDPANMLKITSTSNYYGEGGLHQVYAGVGWNAYKNLSIGLNAGLLWGTCNHSTTQTFEENGIASSSFDPLTSVHEANLTTYNLEAGVQYPVRIGRNDWLTTGATVAIGHSIASDAMLTRNAGTAGAPTDTISAPFDIPFRYGVGLAWRHGMSWLTALDVKYEQWSSCHTPKWDTNAGQYVAEKGEYKDRITLRAGVQYQPNALDGHHYFKRVQYRAGLHYSSPYLVINGNDGPHEYGISLGVALPIAVNNISRSTVNVGIQWMRRSASAENLISENYYMLTLGLTFNEVWFMKYKIR